MAFCSNCGGALAAGAKFCGGCGKPVAAQAADQTQAAGQTAESLTDEAITLDGEGNPQAAVEKLNQAIAMSPGYARAYAWRGYIISNMDNADEGLPDLNKALQIDPNDCWSWAFRAEVYQNAGDFPLAEQDYDKALQINPDFESNADLAANTSYCRAMNRKNEGNFDAALPEFNRAIELDQYENPMFLLMRGDLYADMNQFALALADTEKAIAIDPELAQNPVIIKALETWRQNLGSDAAAGASPKFCPNCGGGLAPGAKFCGGCGKPVA